MNLGMAAYGSWLNGGSEAEGGPDREMRDLVLMVMIRSLRPLELSAAKLLTLSNETFLLVRTSICYYYSKQHAAVVQCSEIIIGI